MAGGQKKAILRQWTGALTWGYLPASSLVDAGSVTILDPAGKVNSFALNSIQWIAYVRDFNLDDPGDPERLGRRSFPGRPRLGGLWLRLTLLDGQPLEGVTDFDLTALNALAEDQGLTMSPPDGRSNTLRLFLPRTSLRAVEVLGWIGAAPRVPRPTRPKPADDDQPGLFGS